MKFLHIHFLTFLYSAMHITQAPLTFGFQVSSVTEGTRVREERPDKVFLSLQKLHLLHDSSSHQTLLTDSLCSCQANSYGSFSFFQESVTLNSGNISYSLFTPPWSSSGFLLLSIFACLNILRLLYNCLLDTLFCFELTCVDSVFLSGTQLIKGPGVPRYGK